MTPLQSSHAVTDLERPENDSVADAEVEISDDAEAASEPPPVLLRGTRAGLEIVIDTRAPMSEIADELTSRLEQSPGFFAGNDARVRVIGRLPVGALARLEEVTTRFALRIVEIGPPPASPAPDGGDRDEDVAAEPDAPAPAAEEPPPLPVPASSPRMVIGPIRSGTTLDAPTDLIVVGDVNPGAEIHARGNIIVLGRLRGVAHAAVGGQSGFIFALRFEPQQLRIGRLVARAGESDAPGQGAEIAYATDRTIVVERYQGRLPSGLDAAA
jgi:septum site-determining protein MinC